MQTISKSSMLRSGQQTKTENWWTTQLSCLPHQNSSRQLRCLSSTELIKLLIDIDATGPRCSHELPIDSPRMEACGGNRWVPSPWQCVWLGRVSLFLWKWNLGLVDCRARSQVCINSMLKPFRITYSYRQQIFIIRILMSSASLGEDSLKRVCGECKSVEWPPA